MGPRSARSSKRVAFDLDNVRDRTPECRLQFLDRGLTDLLLVHQVGEPARERQRQLERAREPTLQRVVIAMVASWGYRGSNRQCQRRLELLQRRVGKVGDDFDEVDAVRISGRRADDPVETLADEERLLGWVAIGVVHPGDERTAAGADDVSCQGEVVEFVELVAGPSGSDASPGTPPLAVVAEGDVTQVAGPVGGERDRPAGEVAGGGEGCRNDLEAIQGGCISQLAVEGAGDLGRGLPEAIACAGLAGSNRNPIGAALLGNLGRRAYAVAAAALGEVLGGVGGVEQLRWRRRLRAGGRDPAGDGCRSPRSVLGEQMLSRRTKVGDLRVVAVGRVFDVRLEEDAELIPADPAHERARVVGRRRHQRRRNPTQSVVPC